MPPRSSRAHRRASSGAIPLPMYSSVFRARWSRNSSSSSWSACAQRNNDRSRSGIVNSQCSGRILRPPSLVSQGNHRVDAHSAPSRNAGGKQRDPGENRRYKNKRHRVGWLHLVQQAGQVRSEEHTSELQSPCNLVCRLLLEKKKNEYSSVHIPTASAYPETRQSGNRTLHISTTPTAVIWAHLRGFDTAPGWRSAFCDSAL